MPNVGSEASPDKSCVGASLPSVSPAPPSFQDSLEINLPSVGPEASPDKECDYSFPPIVENAWLFEDDPVFKPYTLNNFRNNVSEAIETLGALKAVDIILENEQLKETIIRKILNDAHNQMIKSFQKSILRANKKK